MEPNNREQRFRGMRSSRIPNGLILIVTGFLLLAYKMGAPIGWLFTWPVLLIAIGLLIGFKSRFRSPGSFIMILIGAIFLVDQYSGFNLRNYIVPAVLIAVGSLFILRPKSSSCGRQRRFLDNRNPNDSTLPNDPASLNTASSNNFTGENNFTAGDDGEYIDLHAVLGGIKKNVTSKNFKGGEIVSFMGGSEINFMQADIQHPVTLEVNNVFGGTKLIIPSNWDVKNEISAIFGGIDDKRSFNTSTPDSNKKLLLKGSCVFGGVEVTNY